MPSRPTTRTRPVRHAVLMACLLRPMLGVAAPREILLDQPKVQRALDPLERLATDNALEEGMVDVPDPMVFRTSNHGIDEVLPVEGGRCYVLAGAFETNYPVELTYAFSRSLDQRPIVEGASTGKLVIDRRAGLVRFCVDRPGTVRVSAIMLADNPGRQMSQEWVLVLASRPETQAQRDARHRRIAAQKFVPVEAQSPPTPPPPSEPGSRSGEQKGISG